MSKLAGESSSETVLSYESGLEKRRRDSVFGLIGLALVLICSIAPAFIGLSVITGKRHHVSVNSPAIGGPGYFSAHVNWPWYVVITIAMIFAAVGLYRGPARFAAAALVIGFIDVASIVILILGSPW